MKCVGDTITTVNAANAVDDDVYVYGGDDEKKYIIERYK